MGGSSEHPEGFPPAPQGAATSSASAEVDGAGDPSRRPSTADSQQAGGPGGVRELTTEIERVRMDFGVAPGHVAAVYEPTALEAELAPIIAATAGDAVPPAGWEQRVADLALRGVHNELGLHFTMRSGGRYYFASGQLDGFTFWTDLASGLAHQARYVGQTSLEWSVASHAVLVAEILRRQGHVRLVQLAGLHHDDHECITGDLTSPLRWHLDAVLPGFGAAWDRLCHQVQTAIAERVVPTAEQREVLVEALHHGTGVGGAVKQADLAAYVAESRALRARNTHEDSRDVPPELQRLAAIAMAEQIGWGDGWGFQAAKAFERRHHQLLNELRGEAR